MLPWTSSCSCQYRNCICRDRWWGRKLLHLFSGRRIRLHDDAKPAQQLGIQSEQSHIKCPRACANCAQLALGRRHRSHNLSVGRTADRAVKDHTQSSCGALPRGWAPCQIGVCIASKVSPLTELCRELGGRPQYNLQYNLQEQGSIDAPQEVLNLSGYSYFGSGLKPEVRKLLLDETTCTTSARPGARRKWKAPLVRVRLCKSPSGTPSRDECSTLSSNLNIVPPLRPSFLPKKRTLSSSPLGFLVSCRRKRVCNSWKTSLMS